MMTTKPVRADSCYRCIIPVLIDGNLDTANISIEAHPTTVGDYFIIIDWDTASPNPIEETNDHQASLD